MKYCRQAFIFICFFLIPFRTEALDLEFIDNLHHQGEYTLAYAELEKLILQGNRHPSLGWRTARALFVIAENLPKGQKRERSRLYDRALEVLEEYLDYQGGTKRDASAVIHYYATIKSFKALDKGIISSIHQVPLLLELNRLAIQTDPTYSAPYYFRATYYKVLPPFLGGDKQKMGEYYALALHYSPDSVHILIDTAHALYKRNWKKANISSPQSGVTGDWETISDRELALLLMKRAVFLFETNLQPSKHDMTKINEAYRFLRRRL